MDANVNAWMDLVFRWIHVLAGVMWIGHLWFFNFVNSQLVKTYDADSKKKVLPELMPRALYWFRWGAAYTWITGILLAGLVYYMGGQVFIPEGSPVGSATVGMVISLAIFIVGFGVYDVLWKTPLAKNEMVGTAVSFLLLAAVTFGMSRIFSGRAVFIHVGALFGTIMAANVWMRIWPNQRKIIAGVKGTAPAPDASVPAIAGLRSKHNTYMSIPLIFAMVSNHFPVVYGSELGWVYILVFVLIGWGITKFLYTKAASPAPAKY